MGHYIKVNNDDNSNLDGSTENVVEVAVEVRKIAGFAVSPYGST